MAKVWSAPEEITFNPPQYGTFDSTQDWLNEVNKQEEEFSSKLKQFCIEQGQHELSGEVIGFPVGDGKAMYMIMDARNLIHLPFGDSYQIDEAHARGLRVKDLRQKVDANKAWEELVAKNRK